MMNELHAPSDTDDDGDLDDDLDWLITSEDDKNNSQDSATKEDTKQEEISQVKEETEDEPLIDSRLYDEDFHDDLLTDEETDDDVTDEDRMLLRRNTTMNDADEDYDVQKRLEMANKELAEERPIEELRERRVGFKTSLVDEIPPQSDSSSDSSDSDHDDSDVAVKMEELALQRDEVKSDDVIASGDDVTRKSGKQQSFDSENLIVERDGKFDFVNGDQLVGNSTSTNSSPLSNGVKEDRTVTLPPIKSRPKSAPTSAPSRPMPRRPVSAAPTQNPRSRMQMKTFAYSEETKKIIKERAEQRAKQNAENEKRRKEEERLAREEADDAWKAWVERKNSEIRRQKKEELEELRRKDELNRRDPNEAEEAFQAWLKSKANETRRNRILLQQQQIEQDEGWYLRERKDCDRAFRSWLRQKNEVARKKKAEETRVRRRSIREMKRARKAKKLMESLRQAQQLKYVDYYGYRI